MAEAATLHSTRRDEFETLAIVGADSQLNTIEGVAETIVLMSGSDAFQDESITRSMAFLAGTLLEECKELRSKLRTACR